MPKNGNNRNKRTGSKVVPTGKITVPSHPPSFDMQPWFPLTLRLLNPPANVTVNVLRTAFATQLQFAEAIDIDVRLFLARFWGALPNTTTNLEPVTVRFQDPLSVPAVFTPTTPIINSTTAVIQDFPDRVNRARVGYRYTPAQNQAVIPLSSLNGTLLLFTTAGMGTNSVAYVDLVWRPKVTLAPTVLVTEENECSTTTSAFCC